MRNAKDLTKLSAPMRAEEMKSIVRTILLGALVLPTAKAQAGDPSSGLPPAYTVLRYDEDYSYLHNPSARTDFFDPIKYIPLGRAPDWYLTFAGQVRDRYEYFENYQFGKGPQDNNGYNLVRVLASADVHLGPNLRVFAEGISATEQGRNGGPRASDVNEIDLFQGFADFVVPLADDASLTLRGGRQVMVFGDQRLIGVSDWTNVRRSFDAGRAIFTVPGNELNVFYAQPVQVKPHDLDDDIPGTFITGVYDIWEMPGIWVAAKPRLEMYALYNERQSITFNTTTAREDRFTGGIRFTAHPKSFDFDIEPDYQFGQFKGKDTHSFSVAAIAGYSFENVALSPRPFVGFDIAGGGDHNNPGNTFDQLFPSGHDKFGVIDTIGRQNIIDVHPGVTLKLLQNKPVAKLLTLLMQYRQFWRESNQDAVYTSSGSVLRASGTSQSSEIGGELDVQLDWHLERHLSAYVGYAHFFHGAFISQTGPNNDINFTYASLSFTF